MNWRVWALATASVLAGWANAQTPTIQNATNVSAPALRKDATPEPGTMILRDADHGQPQGNPFPRDSGRRNDGFWRG